MTVYRNLIGGEWRDGVHVPNINPSNLDEVVGEAAYATAADVHDAVAAARTAFKSWSLTTPLERSDLLNRIADAILARRDELGRLISTEQGKILSEGLGEATRASQVFRYFAGEALRAGGERFDSLRPGIDVAVTREPIGVVGLITPWNFPLAIPAWKMAPALAYGNTVVLKPAELTPASAHALVEIVIGCGVPEGVVNLVMGEGRTVGDALLHAQDVAGISFTGSVGTGRIAAVACAERGARIQAEMGGKNGIVVLEDANYDAALTAAVNGAFFATGQRCTASSRIIVQDSLHDRFVEDLKARMLALKIGPALDAASQIGPIVDERQMAQNLRYLDIGRSEGATVTGGGVLERATRGHYFAPALFTDTTPDMRINQEEIFGPLASVIRVADYDEALAVLNGTRFGLSSCIFTNSLAKARHFQRHAETGMVMVNLSCAGTDFHAPFGGRKASNYGPREQGGHARDFYTVLKTAYVA